MVEPTFDPRFDPAFQRGYEPQAHAPKVPRIRPGTEPIGEPPAAIEPEAPQGTISSESSAAKVDVDVLGPIRKRVNPYLVTLWVVAVLFVLGGTALLLASYLLLFTSYTSGPAQAAAAQALYVFGSTFGAPLITVGLATAAGLIFFFAWRSRSRTEGLNR